MSKLLKKQPASRIIAEGFILTILISSGLLMMPFSIKDGVHLSFIDALYTATSAVCVTGLVMVDAFDTFTIVGQILLALMMQIGGLGVTAIGVGFIVAIGKKINLKDRNLIKEAMNLDSRKGVVKFIKNIFITTVIIELIGAVLCFFVFIKDYSPFRAIGISLFHSVAAFNNSGFDILGGFQSLTVYKDNVSLMLITSGLIFLGGIGFLVIKEVISKKFKWRKFSMHTKVVLYMSFMLLVVGTILIKLTVNNITWLGAFFNSVSARTAGFSTFALNKFSTAGLLTMIGLMFIGASPGSTGGGIKTSTFFVIVQGVKSAATNESEKAFKYSIPKDAFKKAVVVMILAITVVFVSTYLLVIMDPNVPFIDAIFEMVSAFATVGLSTGISQNLSIGSKILTIIVMFIGRLGPLTIATLWHFSRGELVRYPEGNITIG